VYKKLFREGEKYKISMTHRVIPTKKNNVTAESMNCKMVMCHKIKIFCAGIGKKKRGHRKIHPPPGEVYDGFIVTTMSEISVCVCVSDLWLRMGYTVMHEIPISSPPILMTSLPYPRTQ
jgi:hypothetical protein